MRDIKKQKDELWNKVTNEKERNKVNRRRTEKEKWETGGDNGDYPSENDVINLK